jgi:hypothetical protein
MNPDRIDKMDDWRELPKLFAEFLRATPGVTRITASTPDFRPVFTEAGRVSREARVVASACADLIFGAVWATSATYKLARSVSRTARR